ncbi:MAG: MarR family transcriptional regulator [Ichthyobacteriaceae bacterium]|nr:MarR family transcriptional regulator [Ichthyobacteriaceae bacterium]
MEENTRTIDLMLRMAWQGVVKMYADRAAKYGYSMAQGFTLLSISPDGCTPSTRLGPRMGVESTSLSRTLKSLEEKKLIYRKDNPKDGRGRLVCLTEKGMEIRNITEKSVEKFNIVMGENVSPQKLKHFYEVADLIIKMSHDEKILGD